MKIKTSLLYCFIFCAVQLRAMDDFFKEKTALDAAKQHWLSYAETCVRVKTAKFLKKFNIQEDYLSDRELIAFAQQNIDSHVDKEILKYKNEILRGKKIEKCQQVKALAYSVARALQIKSKICIIPNENLDTTDLQTLFSKKLNTCWIVLNIFKYEHTKEELADGLRHEFCHIVYQDILSKDMIKSLAIADNPKSLHKINKSFLPISRAYETRADVYGTIHSPEYGRYSITLLKKMTDQTEKYTHPTAADRIALLELVHKDLEEAAMKS